MLHTKLITRYLPFCQLSVIGHILSNQLLRYWADGGFEISKSQGGATFAFNCGAPTEFIKAQGDWRGDAYLVYLKLSTKKKLDILQAISARLFNLVI